MTGLPNSVLNSKTASDLFSSILSHFSVVDFGSFFDKGSVDAVAPITRQLEVVSEVSDSSVSVSCLSPECDSASRVALVVGTVLLAVLLAGAASHCVK